MPAPRTSPSDVRAEVVAASGVLHPLAPGQQTLGESLGTTIDQIRQIATDLGLRPYRVWLVHWEWPKSKGVGQPREIYRQEILPTPKVADMSGVPFNLAAVGLTEMGGIHVSKISQRYSEDDLIGRTPDMRDPRHPRTNRANVEFFWEVREARLTEPPPKPRRFVPSGVPMLYRAGMEWRLSLTKSEYTFDPELVGIGWS
jgi:hypothetical protein